jgi:hypothetical protein
MNNERINIADKNDLKDLYNPDVMINIGPAHPCNSRNFASHVPS